MYFIIVFQLKRVSLYNSKVIESLLEVLCSIINIFTFSGNLFLCRLEYKRIPGIDKVV